MKNKQTPNRKQTTTTTTKQPEGYKISLVRGGLGAAPRQLPVRPRLAESLQPAGLNY